MGAANDGLRLTLELCVLVALGYSGFQRGEGRCAGPRARRALLAAVVGVVFVTPNGSLAVGDPSASCSSSPSSGRGSPRSRVELAGVAPAFGIVVVIHLGLTFPLDER